MNASQYEILFELENLKENEVVRIRKFTPRECLRLMGVRDHHIDIMLSCGVSNTQLYRQAGNSIVVDNLVAIFNPLFYPSAETSIKITQPIQLSIW